LGRAAGVRDDRGVAGASDDAFAQAWNDLEPRERAHLRRLVRMGRRIDDPALAPLATQYAQRQRARPWVRFFWVWFIPGALIAVAAASRVHPVLVGAALVLAGEAVFAYFNLRKRANSG
jgi:hypothetical protein